jgi:hypothetical protein
MIRLEYIMASKDVSEIWKRIQRASKKEREYIINSLTPEQVELLRTTVNPYKKPVYCPADEHRFMAFYITNVGDKYAQRFAMTSLVAFLYRMLDEFEPDCDYMSEQDPEFALPFEKAATAREYAKTIEKYEKIIAENPDDVVAKLSLNKYKLSKDGNNAELIAEYRTLKAEHPNARDVMFVEETLDENEMTEILEAVKLQLNIKMTAEEYYADYRDKVQEFLDVYLRYNPDEHVREGYKPNYADKSRTPLEETHLDDVKNDRKERFILPPDDTFARWTRYTQANYECLRQATDDIYAEKSCFETAIAPMEVFSGATEKQCMDKFNEFKKRYANEMETEIFVARMGHWSFLAPWEANRDKTDFYNEDTELLKRIIDQAKEDTRIGQKLLKKRVKKVKNKEIKKLGGPGVATVNLPANRASEYGAKMADDIKMPNIIQEEDVPYDPEDSTNKEIEVNVHRIKPVYDRHQRRIRAKMDNWKFNTRAVRPDPDAVVGQNVAKMRQREEEMREKKDRETAKKLDSL